MQVRTLTATLTVITLLGAQMGCTMDELQKNVAQAVGCGAGVAGGYFAGQALAKQEAKRRHMNKAEEDKRALQYQIGLALAGCALLAEFSGSVVEKMTEEARKKDELATQAAIRENRPQSWVATDSSGNTQRGRVKVTEKFKDPTAGSCVVVAREITVDGAEETILQKQCLNVATSRYEVRGA